MGQQNSCKTLIDHASHVPQLSFATTIIRVPEVHGRMYPNLCYVTILLAHDPLSSSAYPVIAYTHPVANNLPIKTLVGRQLPTSMVIVPVPVLSISVPFEAPEFTQGHNLANSLSLPQDQQS